MIGAIDTGKHANALARASDAGYLVAVEFVPFLRAPGPAPGDSSPVRTLIVERPEVYAGWTKDPRDLTACTRSGYALVGLMVWAAMFRGVRTDLVEYEVGGWKGQLPKAAVHMSLWLVLTEFEKALFPPDTETRIRKARRKELEGCKDNPYGKSKAGEVHNLLDAAALLLVHTGRLRLMPHGPTRAGG